ncbi:MAG: sugar nucleotide-binding protein [Patescibacteria group bacterium]|jgi:UDP-glucose 4,6-dehydratase
MKNNKPSFYVLGASGFMGEKFVEYLKQNNFEVFSEKIDITDLPALKKKFQEIKPDVVINFAGVRAYPNIDWCETHKQETVAVNVAGAINVALAALESSSFPIQIASGCIYSGTPETPFSEEDEPNFFGSFYSRMRVAMQMALKELPVLQIRIRMPISMHSHPRNLLNKIISYKKVISLPNSVTLIEDMFPALVKLAKIRPTGILNLVNDGYLDHKQMLKAYQEIVNPNHQYELISLNELYNITSAKRSNCILSNQKAKNLGIEMPTIDEKRLREIMEVYKKSL